MEEEKKLLTATHHGKLNLAGTVLECDVLEDGTRVVSRNAIFRAFKRTKRGRAKDEVRAPEMPTFIDAKNLQPFIDPKLRAELKPIDYVSKRGKPTSGFKAEIIPMVCDVYLNARQNNSLHPLQEPLAQVAEVLVRSLSKVGIIALVDEATGYQYIRDKDELHKILEAYVRKEFLPWTKRFPDEFYEQMFRLKGWQYNPLTVRRPQLVGKLTNELIYEKLPAGVLVELKRVTPKSEGGNYTKRFHQSLTADIGNPHLERHMASIITLMRISPSWSKFARNFARAFGGQEELPFEGED